MHNFQSKYSQVSSLRGRQRADQIAETLLSCQMIRAWPRFRSHQLFFSLSPSLSLSLSLSVIEFPRRVFSGLIRVCKHLTLTAHITQNSTRFIFDRNQSETLIRSQIGIILISCPARQENYLTCNQTGWW